MKTKFPKEQKYPGGFVYDITEYCGDKTEYKRICALDIDGDGIFKVVGMDKNNLPWVLFNDVTAKMARKEIKIYIEEHKVKLSIEIDEPLYKIGDVLEVMCGAEKNIPIIFAITNYVEDGDYTIQNNKIHYQPNRSTYYLSCQINYQDNPLTKWMYKRQFFTWNKEYLENKNARKIKWDKKILPAQTAGYLTAKDEIIEKIEKGQATAKDLDALAENF